MPSRQRHKTFHTTAYKRVVASLRRMREDAGLTQAALARRLRRSRTYVTKCELGERRIDVLEWTEFCRACRVEPTNAFEKLLKRV
jgi:transcriptional regulator with XRE-family HTH domain